MSLNFVAKKFSIFLGLWIFCLTNLYANDPFLPKETLNFGPNSGQAIDTETNMSRSLAVLTAGQLRQHYGIELQKNEIAIANFRVGNRFFIALIDEDQLTQVGALTHNVDQVLKYPLQHSSLIYKFASPIRLLHQDTRYSSEPIPVTKECVFSIYRVGVRSDELSGDKVSPKKYINSSFALIHRAMSGEHYREERAQAQKPAQIVILNLDIKGSLALLYRNLQDALRESYRTPYHLLSHNCHTGSCAILSSLPQGLPCNHFVEKFNRLAPHNFLGYLKNRGLVPNNANWTTY